MFTQRDTKILREGAYNKALDDVLAQCLEYRDKLVKPSDVEMSGAVQDVMARVERLRIKR